MKKVFLITLFLFSSFKVYSLEVTLTQGSVKPTPIAVTELYSKNSQLTKVGKNISSDIIFRIGLTNLFDTHYRTFASGISAPGRSFQIGLNFKL